MAAPLLRSARALAFVFAAVLAGSAAAEPAHAEYENALEALSSKAGRGYACVLDVVIDLSLSPPDEAAGARLLDEEKSRIETLVLSRFAGNPGMSLRRLRSLAEIDPKAVAAQAAKRQDALVREASAGSTFVLALRIEAYLSGAGGMSEATARLIETETGREAARDVVWTTMAEGGAGTVFVNGFRIR
jgi:hypothetical protein